MPRTNQDPTRERALAAAQVKTESGAAVRVKAESGLDPAPAKKRRTSPRKAHKDPAMRTDSGKAEPVDVKPDIKPNVKLEPVTPARKPRKIQLRAQPQPEASSNDAPPTYPYTVMNEYATITVHEAKREPPLATPAKKRRSPTKKAGANSEPSPPKRKLRFRHQCPVAIGERADRVMSQRMFMLDRTPTAEGEEFKVLGSTGNVYTVQIREIPSCDCPDFLKGNAPCKHVIFVFLKILKLPRSSGEWYQRHILPEELSVVYANAPAPAAVGKGLAVSQDVRKGYRKALGLQDDEEEEEATGEESYIAPDGKRLSAIGDDCPICFEEMSERDNTSNKLVFDLGIEGCGKPIHKECFSMWAATARGSREAVTCVYCRHAWASVYCRHAWASEAAASQSTATIGQDGYVNLAAMAGMSGVRDTSSYHGWEWGSGRKRYRRSRWDDDYSDDAD